MLTAWAKGNPSDHPKRKFMEKCNYCDDCLLDNNICDKFPHSKVGNDTKVCFDPCLYPKEFPCQTEHVCKTEDHQKQCLYFRSEDMGGKYQFGKSCNSGEDCSATNFVCALHPWRPNSSKPPNPFPSKPKETPKPVGPAPKNPAHSLPTPPPTPTSSPSPTPPPSPTSSPSPTHQPLPATLPPLPKPKNQKFNDKKLTCFDPCRYPASNILIAKGLALTPCNFREGKLCMTRNHDFGCVHDIIEEIPTIPTPKSTPKSAPKPIPTPTPISISKPHPTEKPPYRKQRVAYDYDFGMDIDESGDHNSLYPEWPMDVDSVSDTKTQPANVAESKQHEKPLHEFISIANRILVNYGEPMDIDEEHLTHQMNVPQNSIGTAAFVKSIKSTDQPTKTDDHLYESIDDKALRDVIEKFQKLKL